MSNDETPKKKGLKAKLEMEMHPPASKASQYEELALDTLAELLKSENENTRLQAALALLNRPKAAASSAPAADLLKKLTGPLKKV